MEYFEHGGVHKGANSGVRDFSANINPLGMPECAARALEQSLSACTSYPDPQCRELSGKLRERLGLEGGSIVFGCGAADIIYRAVRAAMPRKGIVLAPTFSEYERAMISAACEVRHIMMTEVFFLPDDITEQITPEDDILFLCTPNNPTGRLIPAEQLKRIAKRCIETGTRLVIDMCFFDFTVETPLYDDPVIKESGAVMINAFTKFYGMAGLRVGWAYCHDRSFAEKMELCGPCWSVGVPAMAAACAALDDERFPFRTREYIERERAYLTEKLSNVMIKVYPSDANFLLLRTELPLAEILAEKGIAVRRCDNFRGLPDGGKDFYRIAVKSHEDNMALVFALGRGAFRWLKQ